MNHRSILTLSLMCFGCTDHGAEAVVEPDAPAQAEASVVTPNAGTTTPAVEPADEPEPSAATPAPTALHVAVEGRCRYLGVSIVDGNPLVHYEGGEIVRLDAEGRATEPISMRVTGQESEPAWGAWLPRIEALGGRYPDALFAEVMEFGREGIRGGYRHTSNGWVELDPFNDSEGGTDRLFEWYDRSLLAFAASTGPDGGARFAVVRGKPKGPRFDRGKSKTGCKAADVHQVLVREAGDVVVTWDCEDKHQFVTHWKRDDLAGHTHDLGVEGGWGGYADRWEAKAIAHDGKDGFYVATRGEGGKLWHGHDDAWSEVALPKGAVVQALAVDPQGRLWIAGSVLARREGDAWKTLALPDGKPIDELVGVEFGTPWVRTGARKNDGVGGRVWRIDGDDAVEITVPQSAFFEGEALRINRLRAAGPNDVWADAEFVVQRRGKGSPGRYYRSVLHSKPSEHPLRCGELIDGAEMTKKYERWPTATGGACKQRMMLLTRRKAWDDTNTYAKMAKALKSVEGLDAVRFVEIELGQEKFLAGIATDAAPLALVHKKTKKMRYGTYPEEVCGDAEVLERAGAVIHREVAIVTPPASP